MIGNTMHLYKQVDNSVEICIPAAMETAVQQLFGAEIRCGRREELPDGRLYFLFHISPEKAGLLRRLSETLADGGTAPGRRIRS